MINGLVFQGQPLLAGIIIFAMIMFVFYLTGLAYFRALRYRLSRTYWRGIRGGSDDEGFAYGLSYIWKNVVAAIPLYLLYPWASMSLWNERWSKMSFGPYQFQSDADWKALMKRYLLFYLVPFLLFVGAIMIGVSAAASGAGGTPFSTAGGVAAAVMIIFGVLGIYILMPLAALLYYSKFMRVAIGALRIGDLEFDFTARSPDWILYWLGNLAIWMLAYGAAFAPFSIFIAADPTQFAQQLEAGESILSFGLVIGILVAIIPIAFASSIIRYRRWKFFVVHTEAFGEVNLDRMTQSTTQSASHGEGLLDAFDVGAI